MCDDSVTPTRCAAFGVLSTSPRPVHPTKHRAMTRPQARARILRPVGQLTLFTVTASVFQGEVPQGPMLSVHRGGPLCSAAALGSPLSGKAGWTTGQEAPANPRDQAQEPHRRGQMGREPEGHPVDPWRLRKKSAVLSQASRPVAGPQWELQPERGSQRGVVG